MLLAAFLLAPAQLATAREQPPRPVVIGYVPTWSDLSAQAERIDFATVTHLNVAFVNPGDDAGALRVDAKAATLIATAHARGVKVLFSIGGGGAADDRTMRARYRLLLDDTRRAAFAKSLAEFAAAHDFDGVDVDIEGPSIERNYGAFIHDLAAALKPSGRLLTAALSKGYGGDRVPADVLPLFDFVNIMAYDATGPWAPQRPGPHSSIALARECIEWWLARGVKPAQAVLGVPFYGHGFGAAARKRGWTYADIVEQWPGAAQRDASGATVYYNGIPTIEAKCRLVRDKQLAGVMIWSLDGDAPGEASLLAAIGRGLAAPSPPQP